MARAPLREVRVIGSERINHSIIRLLLRRESFVGSGSLFSGAFSAFVVLPASGLTMLALRRRTTNKSLLSNRARRVI